MAKQSSYTFDLTAEQQELLAVILKSGNYRPATVPYTTVAVVGPDCRINLYTSGKCVVQGKGSEEFVSFVLEPLVLQEARLGYEKILTPEAYEPHMGIDESGKGDFFGPMVTASVYVDSDAVSAFEDLGLRESKRISSDAAALRMASGVRKILKNRFSLVTIGPAAYNRLYMKMRSVNKILAWSHARAIEDLLKIVPDCRKAISDQFGSKEMVIKSLMKQGKKIELVQRHKAESDPAVAAASVLARGAFLLALQKLEVRYKLPFPKGASAAVIEAGVELAKKNQPTVLVETAKCHFKTADKVLEQLKADRSVLGPEGAATSKPFTRRPRKAKDT